MLNRFKYRHFSLLVILAVLAVAFTVTREFFEVTVGEVRSYFVDENPGSEYYWTVFNTPELNNPAPASEAQFPNGNTSHTIDIGWKKEGLFYVAVAEYDLSGCMNIKVKAVQVNPGGFTVSAGIDTLTGRCHPIQLKATFDAREGLTYTCRWEPAELLDDPTSFSPVFIPGSSTRFTVTVTDNLGSSASASVQVSVSEPIAGAGQDVYVYSGETAALDGSGSRGAELIYRWSSEQGTILSGGETMNPVVQGAGIYVLTVTDRFGCTDADSVLVGLLTHEPVVRNDFDTTDYRSAIHLYVLENDLDPDRTLDHSTLRISVPPLNGSASIDFNSLCIDYTPDRDFSGSDRLDYRICDHAGNCYEASVYIVVEDFRFMIPDAFSPNNDGINDYFEIPGIEYYDNNSIEIFNRWGNKVYRAENYGIRTEPKFWDGKSNTGIRFGNEALPSGSYFYVIDLGNGEKRIVGSVYLDR